MARHLSIIATDVGADERASFVADARQRRQAAQSVGCNYWVFEHTHSSSAIVEFFEAGDSAILEQAQRAAGVWRDDRSILREVEL